MKKIMLLSAFVLAAGLASAQSCSKSKAACAAKKASAEASTANINVDEASVLSALAAADILAESDENIVRKECPLSGSISYYQKNVCEKSGKVSMDEVQYDSEANAFVNLSPSEVLSDQEAKVIKTADTVDGKVQSAGKSKKKACCAGKKAACGSKKTGA